jgi:hypothetical protein
MHDDDEQNAWTGALAEISARRAIRCFGRDVDNRPAGLVESFQKKSLISLDSPSADFFTLPIGVRTKLTSFLVIRPHNSVLSVNFSFLHDRDVQRRK